MMLDYVISKKRFPYFLAASCLLVMLLTFLILSGRVSSVVLALIELLIATLFALFFSFANCFLKRTSQSVQVLNHELQAFKDLIDSSFLMAQISLEGSVYEKNEIYRRVVGEQTPYDWSEVKAQLESNKRWTSLVDLGGHKVALSIVSGTPNEGELSHYTLIGQIKTEQQALASELRLHFDVAKIQSKYLRSPQERVVFDDIIESFLSYFKSTQGHILAVKDVGGGFFRLEKISTSGDMEHLGPILGKKINTSELMSLYRNSDQSSAHSPSLLSNYSGVFLSSEGKIIGSIGIHDQGKKEALLFTEIIKHIKPFIDMAAILLQGFLGRRQVELLITQYEAAQSTAKIGNWYVELEDFKVVWSKEMYKLFGWDPAKPMPTIEEHIRLIHPDDLAHWQQAAQGLVNEGIPYKISFRLNRAGEEVWLETNAKPVLDFQGRTVAAFGTTQDVTEGRKLSSEIIRKEDTLSTIMSYVPLSILTFDVSGNCGYANEEWSRLTGLEMHDSLGSGWRSCVFEADRDQVYGLIDIFRDDKTNFEQFETRIVHRKDEKILWVSGKVIRMFDESSNLIGYLVTLLDVTEVKRREKEVKEALNRLELALYSGELGLWDWHLRDNEIAFDERWCSMLGLKVSEVEATIEGFSSLLHPEDRAYVFQKVDMYLKGEIDDYEIIMRMKHKDGRWIPILSKGKIIERLEDGSAVRFTGTHLDFTRQKQIEDELREAKDKAEAMSKVKSVFLANMSHEIRSPLNGIVGMTELLKDHVTSEEGKVFLQSIYSCSDTLLKIIGDILDYSKLEADRFDLTLAKYNLKELVNETVLSFEGVKRKKEVAFNFTWDERLAEFYYCDGVRIKQILYNLISNAFKFTLKGRIELSVTQGDGEEVIIKVSDTGIGIAKDKEHLLFERFSQLDAGMTKAVEGTGLGLVIVKNLTTLMGGEIVFKSTLRVGTTFTVILPLVKASVLPVAKEKALDCKGQRCLSILVAEDNPINQTLIKKMLENCGHHVVLVANGQEAVDEFERHRNYDLILMDLQMPVLDGLTATKILKQRHQSLPPIIAVTANVFEEDKLACEQVGMDHFLSKPIKKAQLQQMLEKFF